MKSVSACVAANGEMNKHQNTYSPTHHNEKFRHGFARTNHTQHVQQCPSPDCYCTVELFLYQIIRTMIKLGRRKIKFIPILFVSKSILLLNVKTDNLRKNIFYIFSFLTIKAYMWCASDAVCALSILTEMNNPNYFEGYFFLERYKLCLHVRIVLV